MKASPGHERKNYSTLPLIDSAGAYANSYTSTQALSLRQQLWQAWNVTTGTNKAGETKSVKWRDGDMQHIVREKGKDWTQAMLWYTAGCSRPVWCCMCNKTRWGSNQRNRPTEPWSGDRWLWVCLFYIFSNLLSTFLPSNLTQTNSGQAERNWKQRDDWEKWTQHEITQNLAVTDIIHCGHSGEKK